MQFPSNCCVTCNRADNYRTQLEHLIDTAPAHSGNNRFTPGIRVALQEFRHIIEDEVEKRNVGPGINFGGLVDSANVSPFGKIALVEV